MIAEDQPLLTIQARQVFVVIVKGKVAKMINHVAFGYGGIPMHDHRLVHFLDGGKRSISEFNNPPVPEVMIGCEPDIHFIPPSNA